MQRILTRTSGTVHWSHDGERAACRKGIRSFWAGIEIPVNCEHCVEKFGDDAAARDAQDERDVMFSRLRDAGESIRDASDAARDAVPFPAGVDVVFTAQVARVTAPADTLFPVEPTLFGGTA